MSILFRILRPLGGLYCKIFYPTKYFGPTKFEKNKKMILAINHLSNMDPVIFISKIKPQLNFWAKKELFCNRVFAWFFKKMGAIAIDRKNPSITSFKSALTVLKENKVFGLFPEGTRNKGSEYDLKLKSGVALIGIKSEAPIRIAVMKRKPKLFRRNYVFVDEPFFLTEFFGKKPDSAILDQAIKIIEDKFLQAKEKLDKILQERKVKI